ncbi:hypothetical protein K438DRAFT_2019999 [Mycena galopus ATCC 62051]|nr:hypothetical protein K438DRAFT_2019999 [Mycena galopus ATCC 62051]
MAFNTPFSNTRHLKALIGPPYCSRYMRCHITDDPQTSMWQLSLNQLCPYDTYSFFSLPSPASKPPPSLSITFLHLRCYLAHHKAATFTACSIAISLIPRLQGYLLLVLSTRNPMTSATTHPNAVSLRLRVCLTVATDINAKRKLLLLDWSQTIQPATSLSSVDLLIATSHRVNVRLHQYWQSSSPLSKRELAANGEPFKTCVIHASLAG